MNSFETLDDDNDDQMMVDDQNQGDGGIAWSSGKILAIASMRSVIFIS